MPIHFRCRQCERRLRVGTEKAGQQVKCPHCAAVLWVPSKDEAAALAAMSGESPETLAGYQYDEPPSTAERDVPTPQPAAAPQPQPPAPSQPAGRLDLVPIPRAMLYAQGVLIAATALVAFILGYVIGSGGAPPPEADNAAAAPLAGPVRIEGRLSYERPDGETAADAGSIVILLPERRVPDERIPVAGLRTDGPPLDENAPLAQAIESLGGACQRTDQRGRFLLTLPEPGRYYVLRISRAAQRPGGDPIPGEDLGEMNRFFQPAADLVARQKYTWSLEDFTASRNLIHNFGPSGR